MSDPFAGMASALAGRIAAEQRPEPKPRQPRVSLPYVANPWGLTGLQCAVMDGVVACKSSFTIGDELCISRKTVDAHLDTAKRKLKADGKLMAALEYDRWKRAQ